MDQTAAIALAAGSAWASGLNVYAVILILGVLGNTGYMTLPADLENVVISALPLLQTLDALSPVKRVHGPNRAPAGKASCSISISPTVSDVGALVFLASSLSAQWVSFSDQTSTRLVADPGVGSADPEEKDYAWGDVDQDGDTDLLVVDSPETRGIADGK